MGLAGLFNVGVMGFAALGGLAGVLIVPPVSDAWQAGGLGILLGLVITIGTVVTCMFTWSRIQHLKHQRYWIMLPLSSRAIHYCVFSLILA